MRKGISTPSSPHLRKKSPAPALKDQGGISSRQGQAGISHTYKISPPSATSIFSFATSTFRDVVNLGVGVAGISTTSRSRAPSPTPPEKFRAHLNSFTPLVDAALLGDPDRHKSLPAAVPPTEAPAAGLSPRGDPQSSTARTVNNAGGSLDGIEIPPPLTPTQGERALHDFDAIVRGGDRRHIKLYVRANQWSVNHPVRAKVWLALCDMTGNVVLDDYDSIVAEHFSDISPTAVTDPDALPVPTYIDTSFMLHYHLNTDGKFAVKRIVSVIEYTRPDITYAPQIYFLASLFLHYMCERDAYNSICHLLSAHRAFFIFQTKISFTASGLVLAELAARFAPAAHKYLAAEVRKHVTTSHVSDSPSGSGPRDVTGASAAILEGVYAHWLHWIFQDLPFPYLVRIVDCYLAEGCKVLYRVALALLILFRKESGGHRSKTMVRNIIEERVRETDVFEDSVESGASSSIIKSRFKLEGSVKDDASTPNSVLSCGFVDYATIDPSPLSSGSSSVRSKGSRPNTFSSPTTSHHSKSLALPSTPDKGSFSPVGKTRHTSIASSERAADRYQNLSIFISAFCQSAQFSPDKLLKVAFGIRGLSSGILRELTSKNENFVRNRAAPIILSASSANLSSMANAESSDEDISADPSAKASSSVRHRLGRTSTHPAPPFTESHILARDQFRILWSWIPTRYTVYAPALLFSTLEQGISLKTFFNRVDGEEPTIILIKTASNEIFGAYCSTDWKCRNAPDQRASSPDTFSAPRTLARTSGFNITGNFFGTGETFVFTIFPRTKKYPWIGTYSSDPNALNSNMFQSASNSRILLGGGGGKGHSIQLNESLERGTTGECETFANPPLSQDIMFEIKILEVLGFK